MDPGIAAALANLSRDNEVLKKKLDFLQRNAEAPSLAAAVLAQTNLIINGDFRVNQRGTSSGTSLAAGAYFLDRWKSSAASTAVTWTGDDTVGRVLTIPASKSIQQIAERTDMPAGDYTLVWTGTAQARIYNAGATPPAYAAGPMQVVLDGTANAVVEFGPGTVSKVALRPGTAVFPFAGRRLADELRLCQRYYWSVQAVNAESSIATGGVSPNNGARYHLWLPAALRAQPTIETSAANHWANHSPGNVIAQVSALSVHQWGARTPASIVILASSSTLPYGQNYQLQAAYGGGAAWLALNAEL